MMQVVERMLHNHFGKEREIVLLEMEFRPPYPVVAAAVASSSVEVHRRLQTNRPFPNR